MILTPAELDSFVDRIADAVAAKLANEPKLIDRLELCRQLGLSESTVDRLTKSGKIPSIPCGRRIKYVLGDVLAALADRGVCDE